MFQSFKIRHQCGFFLIKYVNFIRKFASKHIIRQNISTTLSFIFKNLKIISKHPDLFQIFFEIITKFA